MKLKSTLLACTIAVTAAWAAQAKEFKFAFQGDAGTMDPYGLNETFTLGFQGNIYEGLTRRGPDLKIEPGLAERWELMEPTRWRFHLRKGVKFHDGRDFTADDVVFSAERVRAEGSDLKTRLSADTEVKKVDSHTVDFITKVPNPIIFYEWDTWYMMSKGWAEANNAVKPESVTAKRENFATRNANGTGPFRLVSREPDVKTVAEPNPAWWDKPTHNLTKVTFTPIASDATRVAALLSGQVDWADPIPVQDMKRIDDNPDTKMMVGPELRTIFLGWDQHRPELLHSSVKGKNPFQDKRVRQAMFQAIDIQAIHKVVMRGLSRPSAMMIAPGVNGFDDAFKRRPYDPEAAKKLLAEAGYANGFEVDMDCPNDRYVNDEAICQAVTSMLAKVGVKINLVAQTKSKYFAKVLAPKRDTSFYLLGWTPGSFDSWNVLFNIEGCIDDAGGRGKFNLGGYCNKKVDELTDKILVETDKAKRDSMIAEAWKLTLEDVSYIPLHQQSLAWGMRKNVELKQRADNIFNWKWVRIN
jgi:peptide/nickel transport system substrate-binding protein